MSRRRQAVAQGSAGAGACRLVSVVLETCGQYFSKGPVAARLDGFLLYLGRYLRAKPEAPLDVVLDLQAAPPPRPACCPCAAPRSPCLPAAERTCNCSLGFCFFRWSRDPMSQEQFIAVPPGGVPSCALGGAAWYPPQRRAL